MKFHVRLSPKARVAIGAALSAAISSLALSLLGVVDNHASTAHKENLNAGQTKTESTASE